jgi:hypothetical protein
MIPWSPICHDSRNLSYHLYHSLCIAVLFGAIVHLIHYITFVPKILDVSLVFNARHSMMENYGPYFFIGVGPPNFKLPLPIE